MSDYSIKAVLSADVSGFTGAFKQAESAVGKFKEATSKITGVIGDTVQKVNQHVESIGHSMQTAGAATSALGMKGLKSFGDFQASLNKAAVVAGGTSRDIKGLADVANEMGKDLPLSAKDSADAMVGMAQNGASLKELRDTFPAIAKASTAAGEDIGKTANAVQQSMNIWGGSSARNAAILVNTANASNAAVGTMADAFANVGTTAKSLGMNLSTVSESIGLLTNKGMTTQRASQDLNHALVQMIKPSKAAQDVMAELGISYTDASGKMKPFRQILGELSTALQGYTPAQQKAYEATLFGTAGMSAIAPLIDSVRDKTGNATTSWDAYAKQQEKATGTVKQANETLNKQASEMQKNVGSALEQVGGSWDDLNNQAMQDNNKLLQSTLHMISNLLTHLKSGKDGISRFARAFIGLAPIIGPVVTVVGTFLANLSKIAAVINPFTIAAALIGALSLKVVAAYQASKPFREEVQKIAKTFESVFGPALKHATGYLGDLFDMLAGKKNKRAGDFKEFGDNIANSLKKINWQGIAENIKKALSLAISIVKSSVNRILAILKGINFGAILRAAKPVLGELQQAFETVFKAIFGGHFSWSNVGKEITAVITGILKAVKPVLSVITTLVIQIVKTVKTLFKSLNFKAPKDGAQKFADFLKKLITNVGKFLRAAIRDVAKMFQGFSQSGALKEIKKAVKAIGQAFKDLVTNFAKEFSGSNQKGKKFDVWKEFGKALGNIAKKIADVTKNVANFISYLAKHDKNLFKQIGTIAKIAASIWGVYKAYKGFMGLVKKIEAFIGIVKKVVGIVKTVGGAIKFAFSAFDAVTGIVGKVSTALHALWGVLAANPILLVVAAIAAVTAALVIFFTKTKKGRKMWANFVKWLKNVWKGLKKNCEHIWKAITDGINGAARNIQKGWQGITGFFSKIGKGIKNVFTGLVKWFANLPKNMLNIGKNIIQGLINGIMSKAQDLWDKVKGIAKHLPKWMQGPLQINSPSRVMRDQVGKYIGAGLIEGIDSTTGDVMESARKLANSAIPSLDTTGFTSKLNGLRNQARSSLTGHFSQELNLAGQPAYINLNLGGTNYQAFVSDITSQQNRDLNLAERRF